MTPSWSPDLASRTCGGNRYPLFLSLCYSFCLRLISALWTSWRLYIALMPSPGDPTTSSSSCYQQSCLACPGTIAYIQPFQPNQNAITFPQLFHRYATATLHYFTHEPQLKLAAFRNIFMTHTKPFHITSHVITCK